MSPPLKALSLPPAFSCQKSCLEDWQYCWCCLAILTEDIYSISYKHSFYHFPFLLPGSNLNQWLMMQREKRLRAVIRQLSLGHFCKVVQRGAGRHLVLRTGWAQKQQFQCHMTTSMQCALFCWNQPIQGAGTAALEHSYRYVLAFLGAFLVHTSLRKPALEGPCWYRWRLLRGQLKWPMWLHPNWMYHALIIIDITSWW